jgi:hypothetical protein
MGVMPHAPRSAIECEGIDLHTPKGTLMLGVGVMVDFRMFKEQKQGPNPMGIEKFFISLENY